MTVESFAGARAEIFNDRGREYAHISVPGLPQPFPMELSVAERLRGYEGGMIARELADRSGVSVSIEAVDEFISPDSSGSSPLLRLLRDAYEPYRKRMEQQEARSLDDGAYSTRGYQDAVEVVPSFDGWEVSVADTGKREGPTEYDLTVPEGNGAYRFSGDDADRMRPGNAAEIADKINRATSAKIDVETARALVKPGYNEESPLDRMMTDARNVWNSPPPGPKS